MNWSQATLVLVLAAEMTAEVAAGGVVVALSGAVDSIVEFMKKRKKDQIQVEQSQTEVEGNKAKVCKKQETAQASSGQHIEDDDYEDSDGEEDALLGRGA